MKKGTAVLLGLLIVIGAGTVHADGMFGLPSLGGLFGNGGACGPTGCDPSAPSPALDFYVGWQGGSREVLSTSTDDPVLAGALWRSIKLSAPFKGIWLGAGTSFEVKGFSIIAQGWYLFNSNQKGDVSLDNGFINNWSIGEWNPQRDKWYVDLLGGYGIGGNSCTGAPAPFSVLIGARYDHHQLSTESTNVTVVPFRLDVDLNGVVPLVGVQWAGSGIVMRALYGPWAFVQAKAKADLGNGVNAELSGSKNLSKAQFVEFFGEYSKTMSSNLQMGIFARLTLLHASTALTFDQNVAGVGALQGATYDLAYDRLGWTLGAKASMTFTSPGFGL